MNSESFFDKDISDILFQFGTSELGLKTSEVKARQAKYGANILPKKKRDNIFKIFFREFIDPMVILLVVAIAASIVAGEYIDAIVIAFIILVDAIMGTYQENKANNTAAALEDYIKVQVKVVRDSEEQIINAEELVPGDYVFLESGDKISADMRLIETHNFSVDESILTGESVQIAKHPETIRKVGSPLGDQRNMAFSGTTVVSGRAKAVVVKTGLSTELGKIAESLNETNKSKTPLAIRVGKLSRQITIMIVVIAAVLATLLISKRVPYTEILITVIAFAVSAMPEGLPLALTMALTIASNRMAKKNVIVRKLSSAESLGSCTVIASDKTGTLTVNQQTAKKIVLPNGEEYLAPVLVLLVKSRVMLWNTLKKLVFLASLIMKPQSIMINKLATLLILPSLCLVKNLALTQEVLKSLKAFRTSRKINILLYFTNKTAKPIVP